MATQRVHQGEEPSDRPAWGDEVEDHASGSSHVFWALVLYLTL